MGVAADPAQKPTHNQNKPIKHPHMKTHPHYSSRLFLTAVLTASCFTIISGGQLLAQKPAAPAVDPAVHAAHVAAGTHPATPAPDAAKGDPALAQQLSQLQAKVAQLEAALAKSAPPMAANPAMGMGKMKPAAAMPAMSAGSTPAPAMPGMSASAAPANGTMNMMGMMDKMMGMMDKMMGMGGGAMPAAAPMAGGGMGMDAMEMGGGAMPATPPASGMANMSGGGGMMSMMGMMDMDMMGMGGGGMGAMPKSALPGFPGASHLYHIGATGFFLDHPQHIALTTAQQAGLNKAREQALLAKGTADRAVKQAEQDLWTLTASDQPDATQIEAKIREIGKLRGDERLAFIHAVGDASKLLTDEQRKILTGFAPPAPAAAPMAPMKNM